MYNHNFCCELVLILSKVPSKRGRAELHIDTMNKTNGAKIAHRRDDQVFRHLWLMPCSNLGQTCNKHNRTVALSSQVGKYQNYLWPDSWDYQVHSPSTRALWVSNRITCSTDDKNLESQRFINGITGPVQSFIWWEEGKERKREGGREERGIGWKGHCL